MNASIAESVYEMCDGLIERKPLRLVQRTALTAAEEHPRRCWTCKTHHSFFPDEEKKRGEEVIDGSHISNRFTMLRIRCSCWSSAVSPLMLARGTNLR
jgi:hypothetical protein